MRGQKMNHIILEGFMGSGKSAVAKALAKEMDLPLIDIDKQVESRLKMRTTEVYERFGDVFYRAMETLILDELQPLEQRAVIVLGSGLALMPQNAPYLKNLGKVYYLKVSKQLVVERLSKGEKHSWLRAGDFEEHVTRMLKEREPAYRKVADYTIKVDGKKTAEIVQEIIADDCRTDEAGDAPAVNETDSLS